MSDEIKITEEMMRAGAAILLEADVVTGHLFAELLAEKVFLAMMTEVVPT